MTIDNLSLVNLVTVFLGISIFIISIYIAAVSLHEKEKRATRISVILAFLLPTPYILIGCSSFSYQQPLALLLIIITIIICLILFLPIKSFTKYIDPTPVNIVDERNTMFSRQSLIGNPKLFNEYYQKNPQYKEADDKFRSKPGFMKEGSLNYNQATFEAAKASFQTIKHMNKLSDLECAEKKTDIDNQKMSVFIKNWAQKLGAVSAGITELKDYHKYSVRGRGNYYGKEVKLNHKYAIAVLVEMDKQMLDTTPDGLSLIDDSRQYFDVGAIAIQIAEFIRQLGYPAKAHTDGNYDVICPLVAKDAGLGEIGRIGLLITPNQGPRVRIAVITTDMPLIIDKRKFDDTVIDFCTYCKKCSTNCPVSAIPENNAEDDNNKQWKIYSEKCFTYWCTIGSNCGRCIRVCPYSHPNNLLHKSIHAGVNNSAIFRRFAIWMDDLFYGKKPQTTASPDWVNVQPEN